MAALLLVILMLFGQAAAAREIPSAPLKAEGAILVAERSGKVLFEQNSRKQLYPASTTKVMTALLALEHASAEEMVAVGEEILLVGPNSSTADLAVGDEITLGELIHAMMIPSGNDAAYAAAVYIARRAADQPELSVDAALLFFSALMNERARELGALDTNFVCPDGYHHPDHRSTAYDLALIAREAMGHEFIRKAAQSAVYQAFVRRGGSPVTLTWFNTNLMLHPGQPPYYPLATGLKTGSTPEAGSNLIASAEQGELALIAVTLNSTADGRWRDTATLFEYGFNHFRCEQVVAAGEVVAAANLSGQAAREEATVPVVAAAGFTEIFYKNDLDRIEREITWENSLLSGSGDRALSAPLEEGQAVGTAIYLLDGELLFETELLAARSAAARFPWEKTALPGAAALILLAAVNRRRAAIARSKRRKKPKPIS